MPPGLAPSALYLDRSISTFPSGSIERIFESSQAGGLVGVGGCARAECTSEKAIPNAIATATGFPNKRHFLNMKDYLCTIDQEIEYIHAFNRMRNLLSGMLLGTAGGCQQERVDGIETRKCTKHLPIRTIDVFLSTQHKVKIQKLLQRKYSECSFQPMDSKKNTGSIWPDNSASDQIAGKQ